MSMQAEKAKGLLARFRNDHMHHMLDLLDIPRSDLKDKVNRLNRLVSCSDVSLLLLSLNTNMNNAMRPPKYAGARHHLTHLALCIGLHS